MDFKLSDEQRMIQEMVRSLREGVCRASSRQASAATDVESSPPLMSTAGADVARILQRTAWPSTSKNRSAYSASELHRTRASGSASQ